MPPSKSNDVPASKENKSGKTLLPLLMNGPFPFYWVVVSIGTGYKSEVYVNGVLVDKVDTFTNYTTKKNGKDLLKNGENEVIIKILEVADATKSYFKQELSVDVYGTPNSPETKSFRFDDTALNHILAIDIKENMKKGTFTYLFNLKK